MAFTACEYFRSRRSLRLPNIFLRMLLIIAQDVLKARGVGTPAPTPPLECLLCFSSARHLKEASGILWSSPLAHFEVQVGSRRAACSTDLGNLLAA